MKIRPATSRDADEIWNIIAPLIRGGDVYALPLDMSREDALAYWMGADRETFVAEGEKDVIGTYYLRANQAGGGSHVGNCGYAVAPDAQGRGIARAMCLHSLRTASARGFRAMQFNFVVDTNVRAVKLWTSLGFETVGRLPLAFAHPDRGFVDARVMYRALV